MLTQLYYKMNLIYFKIMQNFRVLQNSTVEQLHKKLEFIEYLFRCSHNSIIFHEQSVWSWNRLTKKVERSSAKHPLNTPQQSWL